GGLVEGGRPRQGECAEQRGQDLQEQQNVANRRAPRQTALNVTHHVAPEQRARNRDALVLRAKNVEKDDYGNEGQEAERVRREQRHRSNRRCRKYWMTMPSNGQDVSMRR